VLSPIFPLNNRSHFYDALFETGRYFESLDTALKEARFHTVQNVDVLSPRHMKEQYYETATTVPRPAVYTHTGSFLNSLEKDIAKAGGTYKSIQQSSFSEFRLVVDHLNPAYISQLAPLRDVDGFILTGGAHKHSTGGYQIGWDGATTQPITRHVTIQFGISSATKLMDIH
jgi:hypothetical protein